MLFLVTVSVSTGLLGLEIARYSRSRGQLESEVGMSHFCKPTGNCSPQALGSDSEGSRHGLSPDTMASRGDAAVRKVVHIPPLCFAAGEKTRLLLTGWRAGCEMQPAALCSIPYTGMGTAGRGREVRGQRGGKL